MPAHSSAPELRWCLAAVCGVLAVALALFWFAQPLADDFARGYKGRVEGVIPATVHEYYTWTGRWAGVGLTYWLTSSFDLVRHYPLLLLISPALLGGAIYALLAAADIGRSVRERTALTASSLALYWAGMPHPGETIYWLTGSGENLASLALLLLLLAGLLRFRGGSTASLTAAGALPALALVVAGFHELFGLLLCLLLAGGTLVLWLTGDKRWRLCACCLLAAAAGFLVVYLAPGNDVRRAEFPLAGHLPTALKLTVKQGLANGVPWVLDVRLLAATALVLMLAPQAIAAPSDRLAFGARETAILVGTWVGALGAAFAAASWAIGMEMPMRTRNGIYLIFLLGWFWLLVMLIRQLSDREPPLLAATPLMRRMAAGLFIASMLLTGNTWQGLQDLRVAAPAYANASRERWKSLERAAARGERDVIVEPIKVWPESYITYFELQEDPEYWENWSVAHYFGLDTVTLRPAGESARPDP